jgi:hypothetical protein
MRGRVKFEIKALRVLLREEGLFKVVFELLEGKVLESLNFLRLAVKKILVAGNFGPETAMFRG